MAAVAMAGFVGSVPTSTCPTAPLSRRLLQSGRHIWLAELKTLLLNVSRAVTRDVLITFSPTAVRCAPPLSLAWKVAHLASIPQPLAQGLVCPAVLFLLPVGLHHRPTSTSTSLGKESREVVLGRKEPSPRSPLSRLGWSEGG